MKINKYCLNNGLRLVHYQDLSTQMVALNIVYDVGARDEDPEHTGFAHLFEHLMFGGSVNIPDYDAPLQSAGGENNAWTNNDITNYYLTVPKSNVEIGFWLETVCWNWHSVNKALKCSAVWSWRSSNSVV